MEKKKFDVNNAEEFQNVIGDRLKKARKREINENMMNSDTPHVNHMMVANMVIKIINVLNVDPVIKKVMSMRILGPLKTGKETSRFSIAIELGLREAEVEEIEEAGLYILDSYLQKVCASDFIEKFNREKALKQAVDKLIKNG